MPSWWRAAGRAVPALRCLRERGCGPVPGEDSAERTGLPLPYLPEIAERDGPSRSGGRQTLLSGRICGRSVEEMSVMDVAEAVDGRARLPGCPGGLDYCSPAPAPHARFPEDAASGDRSGIAAEDSPGMRPDMKPGGPRADGGGVCARAEDAAAGDISACRFDAACRKGGW